jgi:hypothetical protein
VTLHICYYNVILHCRRVNAEERQRAKQRADRLAIREFKMQKEWRVDMEKQNVEAPVPGDLKTKYYQFQQNVLFRPIPSHPLWIEAFDARNSSRSALKWLSKPPYDCPIIDSLTRDYDPDSLRAITDGWFTRRIIDTFRGRWNGIRNADGSINRVAMADAALDIMQRMDKLLAEVERVNKWRDSLGGKEASFREKGDQPAPPSKKATRFVKDYRYWLYCELVLLRSELHNRYYLRHDQALSRFSKRQLSWQKCWFQQATAPDDALARIRSVVDGTSGADMEDSQDDSEDDSEDASRSCSRSNSPTTIYSAPPTFPDSSTLCNQAL